MDVGREMTMWPCLQPLGPADTLCVCSHCVRSVYYRTVFKKK